MQSRYVHKLIMAEKGTKYHHSIIEHLGSLIYDTKICRHITYMNNTILLHELCVLIYII